tara:strand:- start:724 stop:1038 length:315 start_codon:yes stop_codon:yes gene_type:complete
MSKYPRIDNTIDLIPRYATTCFMGVLALFNTTKLELREITNSNNELLLQNGQIISSAIIIGSVIGFMIESFLIYLNGREFGERMVHPASESMVKSPDEVKTEEE